MRPDDGRDDGASRSRKPWFSEAASVPAQLLILSLVIVPLFSLAAVHQNRGPNVDVVATALPAWRFADTGSLWLDDYAGANPWLVDARDGHTASNRPPGVIGLAVPGYLLAGKTEYGIFPAAVTAVVIGWAAMAALLLVLRDVLDPSFALVATIFFALGTATWHISAAQLWPHGPGQLMTALALLALAAGAYWRAGWVFGLALLIRPLTAVMAAVTGVLESFQRRSWSSVVKIGLASTAGLAALIAYNDWVFGSPSLSGGYPPDFEERLTGLGIGAYFSNLGEVFFGATNGLFIWSPVLLVALTGAHAAWKTAPTWVKSGAAAGLVYFLVHARLNRASGGLPFNYRYPLEAITLAAPLLALGARSLWGRTRVLTGALIGSALISVAVQAANALLLSCRPYTDEFAQCAFFWPS